MRHGKKAAAEAALAAEAAPVRAAGASDTKDPEPVETMDLEIPASPRREQRRLLDEASEALALKRAAATCPRGILIVSHDLYVGSGSRHPERRHA